MFFFLHRRVRPREMHELHGVPGDRSRVGGGKKRGLVPAQFKTLRHSVIGQSEWGGLERHGAFHHRLCLLPTDRERERESGA